MAGVSLRTISNIERGATAPQREKLWPVLRALDIAPAKRDYPEWVEGYLSALAPLIHHLPEDRRRWVMEDVMVRIIRAGQSSLNDAEDRLASDGGWGGLEDPSYDAPEHRDHRHRFGGQ